MNGFDEIHHPLKTKESLGRGQPQGFGDQGRIDARIEARQNPFIPRRLTIGHEASIPHRRSPRIACLARGSRSLSGCVVHGSKCCDGDERGFPTYQARTDRHTRARPGHWTALTSGGGEGTMAL